MSRVDQRRFIPGAAGRTLWLVFLLLVPAGCGGSSDDPVTADTSGLKPVDESETADPASPKDGTPGGAGGQDSANPPMPREEDIPPASELDPIPPFKDPFVQESDGTGDDFARNPFQVPENAGADQLMAYIEKLDARRPQGATRNTQLLDVVKTMEARLEAAEKMLAMDDLDSELRHNAINTKLTSLDMLSNYAVGEHKTVLAKFADGLKTDDDPRVVLLGRYATLRLMLTDLATEETDDPAPAVAELKALLADENADVEVFDLAHRAAAALQQGDWVDEAVDVLTAAGNRFKDSENEQLAAAAGGLLEQAKMVALQPLVLGAVRGDESAGEGLLAKVDDIFAQPNPTVSSFQIIRQMAQLLEYSGQVDVARGMLEKVKTAFAKHENEQLAGAVAQMIDRDMKRLSIVGQPFVIEGVTADGQPFDWNSYREKVVLVDFWASWCRPCIEEIPNIRLNYEKYKDKGFEVVGINLDDRRADADRFLASADIPWTTVFPADPNQQGVRSDPNAVRYGLEAIPFLVLVDKQGKALALHVRGETLGMKLAELLGPADPAGDGGLLPPDGVKLPDPGTPISPTDDDAPAPGTLETPPPATPEAAPPTPDAPSDAPAATPEPSDGSQLSHETAVFFCALEDPAEPDDADDEPDAEDGSQADEINPYSADDSLTPFALIDYLFEMKEKPRVIQSRPGFTAAVVEAAERVLAGDAGEKHKEIAALTKLEYLHKDACLGDAEADEQLLEFVDELKDSPRKRIAAEIAFLKLERRALESEPLPPEQIEALLDELKNFLTDRQLEAKHLRIASATVGTINRLEDEDRREEHFAEFGKLFAGSQDKKLAAYGKKLAKKTGEAATDVVGRKLELTGATADGLEFDWAAYRGKIVLVQFWATTCPACLQEMPKVAAFLNEHQAKGVEVVGVCLDRDLAKLADFLEKHDTPWTHLAGEACRETAKKYGVRGIPTLFLVDGEAAIVAMAHKTADLSDELARLLEKQKAE